MFLTWHPNNQEGSREISFSDKEHICNLFIGCVDVCDTYVTLRFSNEGVMSYFWKAKYLMELFFLEREDLIGKLNVATKVGVVLNLVSLFCI